MAVMHPRSRRSWENFRKRIAELGGTVLEPEWLGSGRGHRCLCPEGHACSPAPLNVLKGCGICRVCAGRDPVTARDNFCKRVAELGGTVLETKWLGKDSPHKCRCVNNHICHPRPGDVRRGQGLCRACAGNDPVTGEANFRRRVAELGGEVLEPVYLGNTRGHRCRCSKGHLCAPTPANIQRGQGLCRTCSGKDPNAARDAFHRRVAELGGTVVETAWEGVHVPRACICPEGHPCRPTPSSVSQGDGICRTCAGRDPATAWANFRRQIAELGGEVLETAWLGSQTAHAIRCNVGHVRRVKPGNIRSGQGICRTCGWWDRDVLYVVRNPATGCVKFGITSGDGRYRLGVHRTAGYTEILHLETGLAAGVAVLTEQKITTALAMAGAKPVQGREYFTGEHLALIENEIGNWVTPADAAA